MEEKDFSLPAVAFIGDIWEVPRDCMEQAERDKCIDDILKLEIDEEMDDSSESSKRKKTSSKEERFSKRQRAAPFVQFHNPDLHDSMNFLSLPDEGVAVPVLVEMKGGKDKKRGSWKPSKNWNVLSKTLTEAFLDKLILHADLLGDLRTSRNQLSLFTPKEDPGNYLKMEALLKRKEKFRNEKKLKVQAKKQALSELGLSSSPTDGAGADLYINKTFTETKVRVYFHESLLVKSYYENLCK